MKSRLLLTLAMCSLLAPLGTSSRAAQVATVASAAPTAISGMGRTYIYPKGVNRRFSIDCGMNETVGVLECDAMWVTTIDEGGWAIRLNRRRWVAGFSGITRDHYSDYARRRTLRLWSVTGECEHRGPRCGRGLPARGTIRFHAPGRWDVYNRKGRLAAYTRGPQGVAAGLLWLTNPRS
jgi:hypothetical protein